MSQVTFVDMPGRARLPTDLSIRSLKAVPDLPLLPIMLDARYALIPGAAAPDGLTTSTIGGVTSVIVPDSLGRLTWLDSNGQPVHYAVQRDAGGAPYTLPTLTSAADGINGKPAMLCSNIACGVHHVDIGSSGDQVASNVAAANRQLTDSYCDIGVFSGPVGQTGRVWGQGARWNGNEPAIADGGSGFGFLASANGGKMLYQHRADPGEASSANRIVFDRALDDWEPVLALTRAQPVGGQHVGEVRIVAGGQDTRHPFAFAQPRGDGALPWPFTGVLSNTIKAADANTNKRKVAYRTSIAHYPSDAEMDRIVAWFIENYGPF